jgi:replicative DNA helicase
MTKPNVQTIAVDAPFSQEAEEAVLGSILMDPDCFLDVASEIKSGNDFFMLRHNIIWQALEALRRESIPLDHITLADRLEKTGDLETIGGRGYLIQLATRVGTAIHAPVYAGLVRRTAIAREMLTALPKMAQAIRDESLALEEKRAKADTEWLKATSLMTSKDGAWIGDIASELFDEVSALMMTKKQLAGLSTGLIDLDHLMYGFEPSTLTIVAARPGAGKSALMDCFALHVAQTEPVVYATSERSRQQVVRRMVSIMTGIPSAKFKTGKLTPQEAHHFTDAVGKINQLPIYFDDTPMPTPRDLFHVSKWMVERHGAKLVLFDGMYRSKTGIKEFDNDNHRKYGEIALQLKTIARELDIPVVTTHQLSRDVEKRKDKRPQMSDLRESGRIEEEADKILFLYRDDMYNEATEFPNQCDMILEKHRDGSTGTISTYFEKTSTRFMNATSNRVDLSNLE